MSNKLAQCNINCKENYDFCRKAAKQDPFDTCHTVIGGNKCYEKCSEKRNKCTNKCNKSSEEKKTPNNL